MEILTVLGISFVISAVIGYLGVGMEMTLEEIKKSERASKVISWIILAPLLDRLLSAIESVEVRVPKMETVKSLQSKVDLQGASKVILKFLIFLGSVLLAMFLLSWVLSGWIFKLLLFALVFAIAIGAYIFLLRR